MNINNITAVAFEKILHLVEFLFKGIQGFEYFLCPAVTEIEKDTFVLGFNIFYILQFNPMESTQAFYQYAGARTFYFGDKFIEA